MKDRARELANTVEENTKRLGQYDKKLAGLVGDAKTKMEKQITDLKTRLAKDQEDRDSASESYARMNQEEAKH